MQKLIVALVLWCSLSVASAENEVALKLVQSIPLPDVDGRIDHFSIDVNGRRAFLAALTKNTIEVVDLKAGRVIQTLPGFAKPQGVCFVAELNRLFVATGTDGALTMLDGTGGTSHGPRVARRRRNRLRPPVENSLCRLRRGRRQ
jgi:hypothetical protein